MEGIANRMIYLDIGAAMVRATHLLDNAKYLTDQSLLNKVTQVYTFPRFIFPDIDRAESETEMSQEMEIALMNLYKGSNEKYPDLQGQEMGEEERFHVMEVLHNMMANIAGNDPDPLPLVLTEKLDTPLKKRANIMEYAFESLNVPSLYFATTPGLIQISEYRDTGVVLELSESTTHVICIKDGYPLRNFLGKFPSAGLDVSKRYASELGLPNFTELPPMEQALLMLRRGGQDVKAAMKLGKHSDGKAELLTAVKDIYLPRDGPTVVEVAQNSVVEVSLKLGCDSSFFDNLIVGGGLSTAGGIDSLIIEKLNLSEKRNLMKLMPKRSTHGYLAPVVGARILAAVPGFREAMPSRAAYCECGKDHMAGRVV